MARARSLSPDIWTDADFAELSNDAKVLYIGAISLADDDGRIVWEPREIYLRIFARDPRFGYEDVSTWMRELEDIGFLRPYVVNGRRYAHHPNWNIYQKISHPSASKLPKPPDNVVALREIPEHSGDVRNIPEPSPQEKRREEKRDTSSANKLASDADGAVAPPPPKTAKTTRRKSKADVPALFPTEAKKPWEPPLAPDSLPSAFPQDLRELAAVFLDAFGNAKKPEKREIAIQKFAHALGRMRSRGHITPRIAWVAFGECVQAQNGRPLLGDQPVTAMDFIPERAPTNLRNISQARSFGATERRLLRGFCDGGRRPDSRYSDEAKIGWQSAAHRDMPEEISLAWLRDGIDRSSEWLDAIGAAS